jgi:hypothetical protein
MIDVRWPQQRYTRKEVWAGQRFPLLQRLMARAGGGETPRKAATPAWFTGRPVPCR